jgi:hypothetical protein
MRMTIDDVRGWILLRKIHGLELGPTLVCGDLQLYLRIGFAAIHDDHSMSEYRIRIYIGLGFVAGVLLTLGFKDVYPELEARFRRRLRRYSTSNPRSIRKSLNRVQLNDNTLDRKSNAENEVLEGIEACIGNTPLFKIRSLSEATGCEIFAKAEVRLNS